MNNEELRIDDFDQFYSAIIFHFESRGLSKCEVIMLVKFFERLIKKVDMTWPRVACFNTSDFAETKNAGLEGFDLKIERFLSEQDETEIYEWVGTFTHGDQRLSVYTAWDEMPKR